MTHAVRDLGLAASLALVSALAVTPQASAQSTSTAANVYIQIQGAEGAVYGFNASSTGKLSAIPGSPFKLGAEIVGSNKSQFFTLGHTSIHSYGIASNGAIQSQLSQIPVFDYSGSSCGDPTQGTDDAVLDHTGKYIYVMLQASGYTMCTAYQSYLVDNDGSFSFDGDTDLSLVSGGAGDLPSILGSESYAYADQISVGPIGFRRESSGTLELFDMSIPTFPGSSDYSIIPRPDASPVGNYVVLQVYPNGGGQNPVRLGSFSVDSAGNLSSTNNPDNMPQLAYPFNGMLDTAFSPSGDLFAVSSDWDGESGGIQIFNFNGAAPLTLYKTLLSGTPIDQVAWDTSGHLYAFSKSGNKLFVFTVTSTSVTEDTSWSIGSPFKMVVVSQTATCPAPTTNGVNVCSPAQGATVTSPIAIDAAAYIGGGIYRFSLWNGSTNSVKLLNERDSGVMQGSVSLAPGNYDLIFDARNTAGDHYYALQKITVK